jgi:hypothetical protein
MYRIAQICLACCCLSSTAHAATLRTVALSGHQAPGAPSGVNFSSFLNLLAPPALNDAGQTAFLASLSGGGVDSSNDGGLWSEGSGSLALVAREGSQAPGTPDGVRFSEHAIHDFGRAVLNDAGQIAFYGFLTGSGVDSRNQYGIWSGGSGTLALVARSGSPIPGTTGAIVHPLINPILLNNAGQTEFRDQFAIWSDRSGSLARVASPGLHAPGTSDGVNFRNIGFPPALNDAGQTAFAAMLTGSGVDSTNNIGIWSEGSGTLALVARAGDHAPGMPSGVNFGLIYGFSVALNNAGQAAFVAPLNGSGVDSTNDWGLWSDRSGNLELVAREGDQAPGAPSGVNFGDSGGTTFIRPVLNDAGQTAFGARSTDGRLGIWSDGSGSLALIARLGDHAPGRPSGEVFGFFDLFDSIVLNNAGQIAFIGADSSGLGIWATDRTGALQLIAHVGDMLEVAPGDFRTISYLLETSDHVTGNGDGRRSYFNNRGQLAFAATFTDGTSGIFVSNRVAIPELSTFALTLTTLIGCFTTRRSIYRARALNRRMQIESNHPSNN